MSYSIKRSKVRLKDIRQGVTIYDAHPKLGIRKYIVNGIPNKNNSLKSWRVKVLTPSSFDKDEFYEREVYLSDIGVTDFYNGRRVFRKRKQAEAWCAKWKKSPELIRHWEDHMEYIREMDEFQKTVESEYSFDHGWDE